MISFSVSSGVILTFSATDELHVKYILTDLSSLHGLYVHVRLTVHFAYAIGMQ